MYASVAGPAVVKCLAVIDIDILITSHIKARRGQYAALQGLHPQFFFIEISFCSLETVHVLRIADNAQGIPLMIPEGLQVYPVPEMATLHVHADYAFRFLTSRQNIVDSLAQYLSVFLIHVEFPDADLRKIFQNIRYVFIFLRNCNHFASSGIRIKNKVNDVRIDERVVDNDVVFTKLITGTDQFIYVIIRGKKTLRTIFHRNMVGSYGYPSESSVTGQHPK